MRKFGFSLAFGIIIASWPSHAATSRAAPITFHFEGTIRFVDSSLALDPPVLVGTPFTGGYSFDPTGAMDSSPGNPNVGNYFFASGRMWAQIGNYVFETRDLIMYIWNDTISGDLYEPISVTPFVAAGMQWGGMRVVLGDSSGSALDSDALPLHVPNLADYPNAARFTLELPGAFPGIRGNLTSLTPEPGSLVMLALGTFVMAASRGRG